VAVSFRILVEILSGPLAFVGSRFFNNFSTQQFYSYIKSKRSNTSRIPTLKENDNLLSTPKQKAAALNRQYQSVFTEEPPGDILEYWP
jgi:hypothetical protein